MRTEVRILCQQVDEKRLESIQRATGFLQQRLAFRSVAML